ncbi:alpha/beta hydrolase-fold protein [Paenibacillus thalictri]|uniref:Esterase n=1 Tax=Paenibacillus thalictri TaxID=2527873 RepID=A0A4Q9DM00_9BACL|nr:alpha/beta hydrolase-fold protein [Paenibacillus thalictri]TBL76315.1 hypothetical protein EYB31_20175 [Paenibacillus thalictri]
MKKLLLIRNLSSSLLSVAMVLTVAVPVSAAAPVQAQPTDDTITVDGSKASAAAYKINGDNYFKLSDLAAAVTGTDYQFAISSDDAARRVDLTTGKAYTPANNQPTGTTAAPNSVNESGWSLYVDGKKADISAYSLGGNNYFRLRDVSKLVGFGVGYNSYSKTASIVTHAGLKPGAVVAADDNSPTGYTVTFVYDNDKASTVKLSGAFSFVPVIKGRGPVDFPTFTPYEWTPNMDHFGDYTFDMEKDQLSGKWIISMPLPSGAYSYSYVVDGKKLYDPMNNEEVYTSTVSDQEPSKINYTKTNKSTVYVPFDSKKQIYNWSYLKPVADPAFKGTKMFQLYDTPDVFDSVVENEMATFNHPQNNLAIYLPAGYDPKRAEPYKVLYLAHGGRGNEVGLFSSPSHIDIAENAMKDGDVEKFIIVSWNSYASPSDKVWPSWYDWKVLANIDQNIIPFMEKNYNVVKNSSGRAIAGSSAGAAVSHFALLHYPNLFDYYGIWGCGESTAVPADYSPYANTSIADKTVMIGAGSYDVKPSGTADPVIKTIRYEHTYKAYTGLRDVAGVKNITWYDGHSNHDDNTWSYMENVFIRDYLWGKNNTK